MSAGVFEYIVDGVSGISPKGPIDCMVVGVCSTGTPGTAYPIGKRTNLVETLGYGPLVGRLQDVFQSSRSDDLSIIAVPVAGNPATYIGSVTLQGTGPSAQASTASTIASNADVVVKVTTGGDLGTAEISISEDGGNNFADATATPANGIVSIGATGATITLQDGLVTDDEYAFVTRLSIGPVSQSGTGPTIVPGGTVKAAAQVQILITDDGGLNEGSFQISLDDGNSFSLDKAIPSEGTYNIDEIGVSLTFTDADYVSDEIYYFNVLAPVPNISSIIAAIESPLQLFDVGSVYITGPSNSTDWAALGTKADELFADHRPTFFVGESRLPGADETFQTWANDLIADTKGFSHRFVSICCAHGEATTSGGKLISRNWAGLMVGRLLTEKTNRHIGRVKSGTIEGAFLDAEFYDVQQVLEDANYVTAITIQGLDGCYWGDDRTMANDISDYQNIRVVRTVFKGLRLARTSALKFVRDEAEDPVLFGNSGLSALKADIDITVSNTMVGTGASNELAGFFSVIPNGQTISNGVDVELNFIGLPVIESIRLHAKYSIAGTAYDARLEEGGE